MMTDVFPVGYFDFFVPFYNFCIKTLHFLSYKPQRKVKTFKREKTNCKKNILVILASREAVMRTDCFTSRDARRGNRHYLEGG